MQISKLEIKYLEQFKLDMQTAFQQSVEEEFGKTEELILPYSHIEKSLEKGEAFGAIKNGELVGGAIVVVNKEKASLDFLYVKNGFQGQGIGKKLWNFLETYYSTVKIWETFTPYFEKRNIHFYVNCCGFKIVEFYNPLHPEPNFESEDNPGMDCLFRFEKIISNLS